MPATLTDSLKLPCGATLRNRIAKAAMTEGLADAQGRATERHVNLYRKWAEGGAGLLLTGNVMVDADHLERPGNVVIASEPDDDMRRRLSAWAKAGTANNTHLWMQISHPGRQTQIFVNRHPKAPSAIPLGLPGKQFGVPDTADRERNRNGHRRLRARIARWRRKPASPASRSTPRTAI